MKRQDIIDGIANWQAILNSDTDVTSFFTNGNSFTFTLPSNASSSDYIHAYPALLNGVPSFFLIPSEFDNSTYDSSINSYVTQCIIENNAAINESTAIGSSTANRITQTDAEDRMAAWDNNKKAWIKHQVATADGIFQAFALPLASFEVEKATVYMGLKPNGTALALADMVVINKNDSGTYYDDFVQPVPPYGVTLPQSDFYLFQVS